MKNRYVDKVVVKNKGRHPPTAGGAFYGIGFIGAAYYYISTATTFWSGFFGFLKALVWPAFAVYGMLKFLGI